MPESQGFSENAIRILKARYFMKNEKGEFLDKTPSDLFHRVAHHIASAEKTAKDRAAWAAAFFEAMMAREFLPNSPTLTGAGRDMCLSACFVLPIEDSMESIFGTVKNAALVHKEGGGTGFDFSRLRPSGSFVHRTQGVASGPVSFLKVIDAATEAVKQGGTRRGANMGILRVDHPDIEKFILMKRDGKSVGNFNISVAVTDAFMEALRKGTTYEVVDPYRKKAVERKDARKIFRLIVESAWAIGDPGLIFIDRINQTNPTRGLGTIDATNPCGEQPLLSYESCNLGSINLGKMVEDGKINWTRLKEVVHLAVHFLDNVVEINRYPLPQIEAMTSGNRKIGLGVMGWADMLILLGIPYDAEEGVRTAENVMEFIREEGRLASRELAKRRGAFPNFKGSVFDTPGEPPIRNATITTIAPTGTISIIANASSGVEPIFAVSYVRQVMDNDILVEVHPLFERIARERGFYSPELMQRIAEHGTLRDMEEIPADVRRLFVTAHDITPEIHIAMQAAFQKYTDNAVSKTVNFPRDATVEDVAKVYHLAYRQGCKGVTIYRDGSRDHQVLSTGRKDAPTSREEIDAERKSLKRERPRVLKGWTYQMQTGCGPLYVTVNEDSTGLFELFTTMGKAGGCAASQSEAIGRMVSLAWRSGLQARQVIKQLQGISCHSPSGFGENKVLSCADAVAKAIQAHLTANGGSKVKAKVAFLKGACPDCGGIVEHEGGCAVCRMCGYSECA